MLTLVLMDPSLSKIKVGKCVNASVTCSIHHLNTALIHTVQILDIRT